MFDGIILTDFYAGTPAYHQRAIGAYHMASVLRNRGLRVCVIDYTQSFSTEEIELLVQRTVSTRTKFIGLSTTFFYAKMADLNLNRAFDDSDAVTHFVARAKKLSPGIRVFQGGGFHFDKHEAVDHWIPGQYVENSFLKTLNEVCGYDLPADFDFPGHVFSFLDQDCVVEGEPLPVEVSRGCIFSCKFCSFSGRGKKVNTNIKSFRLLADYLGDSHRRFGTRQFYLADDTFNESESKLKDFLMMVKGLDFRPEFCCYIRLDLLIKVPTMLPLLKEMGVRGIAFGIETMNREAGRIIGKATPPEKVKTFLREIRRDYPEFYLSSGFIVGLPGESLESCEATNEWLVENRVLDSWHFAPLVIDNQLRNPNPSFFSLEIERYGYRRVGFLGWARSDLSYDDAAVFCRRINSANFSRIGPSPWILFGTLRGRAFDEVRQTKIADLGQILDREKFDLYKERLFKSL